MTICLYNGTVINGFSQLEECALLVDNGKIADIFNRKRFEQKKFPAGTKLIDVEGAYITAGFIDTHIHGTSGFGTEDCSIESILGMSEVLAAQGVTAFNPTLYPAEEKLLKRAICAVVAAMGKESGAKIMGMHIEGPFISTAKAGVQKIESMSEVSEDFLDRLWDTAEGRIINMTVAPEIKNMRALALSCNRRSIVAQAGHTDAFYENMLEGMQAGILHSTHLFNAMRQMHHRDPGAVGAILIHDEMSCEIIADGVHVHPALFKILLRDKGTDKIVLVTDSLKPTGKMEGTANGEEVVFQNGCFHRKVDGVVAGSSLTMARGVRNLIHFGFSVIDAVRCATANPAEVMHYTTKGKLIPNYDADIAVFDDSWHPRMTLVGGEIVFNDGFNYKEVAQ